MNISVFWVLGCQGCNCSADHGLLDARRGRRVELARHNLTSSVSDPLRHVSYRPGSADPFDLGRRKANYTHDSSVYQNGITLQKLSIPSRYMYVFTCIYSYLYACM